MDIADINNLASVISFISGIMGRQYDSYEESTDENPKNQRRFAWYLSEEQKDDNSPAVWVAVNDDGLAVTVDCDEFGAADDQRCWSIIGWMTIQHGPESSLPVACFVGHQGIPYLTMARDMDTMKDMDTTADEAPEPPTKPTQH